VQIEQRVAEWLQSLLERRCHFATNSLSLRARTQTGCP
jgi:hypothetical protein